MRTDVQLTFRQKENEHGEMDGLLKGGQLAIFMIVGPAAFLRY
jgi:hypothetical protein